MDLDRFTQELAADVCAKLGPALIEWLDQRRTQVEPDPLLTAKQAAQSTGLSETTIRTLVDRGALHRAPGLSEIRIRKSVLDAYGKPVPQPRRKQ